MRRLLVCALAAASAVTLFTACGGDSGPRRTIQIQQTDDACTPSTIDVRPKEPITFEVKNDGKKDREVEGIEGTNLEEVIVPSGRTRKVDYDAPGQEGTQKIKCYVPGGSTTIIEVKVSGPAVNHASDAGRTTSLKTAKQPNDTVSVRLDSMTITPDKTAIARGPVKFVAANASTKDTHELYVLKVSGEDFETAGEIEDIEPGQSGEIVLDLPPGKYLLACLITPGEYGSTTSHFAAGMKHEFLVTQ
jgi:uncharacterized cupredoxin-like copper-binding protein